MGAMAADQPDETAERARPSIRDVLAPTSERRTLRRLSRLLWQSIKLVWSSGPPEFVAIATLQILNGVAIAVSLILVRNLVSVLASANHRGFGQVVPYIAVLAVVMLVTNFASAVQWELQRVIAELVNRQSSGRVLDVASAAPMEAFEMPNFHDRLQRAEMGSGMRPWQITQSLLGILGSAAGVVGILIALFFVQPWLVLFALLAFLPVWFVTASGSKAFHLYSFHMTPGDRKRFYIQRTLTERNSVKEVIAFGLSGFLRSMWDRLYRERISELRSLIREFLIKQLLASVATSVLIVLPLGLIVYLLVLGDMTIAQVVAATAGLVLLRPTLGNLVFNAVQLYEGSLFLEDYDAFLRLKPALEAARPIGVAPSSFQQLAVEDLTFTYPSGSRPALDRVSMKIAMGEVVALVGENGSGKTTLAKLLCGLYTPQSGRILWDSQDIATMDPSEVRRSVAVIFQDYIRYMFTAAENIGVGRHERFDDRAGIHKAAVDAGADGFLSQLPEGYEALLGPEFEGGNDLSAGQWQRVALARAFFRDAPFIILDEPTAALDARSEHELFDSIRSLFAGRAVLLISHRFSTVRSADRIYVLKEGRVVETGSHAALMTNHALYSELFTLQASAYVEANAFEMGQQPSSR
jgi:ATP-binding cassette subfamily B protein